jgi:hypothetical protein
MARPSTYTEELAADICEKIALGNSVRAICREDDMPAISTVFLWLSKYPEFSEQYARAKEESAEFHADGMIEIADNASLEEVQKARLQIDTRKWVASKLKPKKYGDKQFNETKFEGSMEFSWAE